MNTLDQLRRKGSLALIAMMWIFIGVIVGSAWWSGSGHWQPLLSVAIVALPTALVLMGRNDLVTRLVIGTTLPLLPALMLAQWSGSSLQIDLHMIFFAVIASLAMVADWRPIMASAVVTALHHLIGDLVLPSIIFPGGANLMRVMLHAVIVVAETGVLVWLAVALERLVLAQSASLTAADTAKALAAAERAKSDELEAIVARDRAKLAAELAMAIDQLGAALDALSRGDLTHRINQAFPTAYGRIRTDYNHAVGNLERTVMRVSNGACEIDAAVSEIHLASNDLARRTERQAATLEETVVAIKNVTEQTLVTAHRADQVATDVQSAHGEMIEGVEVVNAAVRAMSAIEQSSEEISQITDLIDGIAFKTNLLALNAGVEAARAGDAGLGFAVVANEVRALAQRAADASRDIKQIIVASSKQVSSGVILVGDTGTLLARVADSVAAVAAAITTISLGAQAQAASLVGVSKAAGEMEQVTQQNAAMVEECTSATHSLASQAGGLADQVAIFMTSDSDTAEDVVGAQRQDRAA